jgi:hypothetical protein
MGAVDLCACGFEGKLNVIGARRATALASSSSFIEVNSKSASPKRQDGM